MNDSQLQKFNTANFFRMYSIIIISIEEMGRKRQLLKKNKQLKIFENCHSYSLIMKDVITYFPNQPRLIEPMNVFNKKN